MDQRTNQLHLHLLSLLLHLRVTREWVVPGDLVVCRRPPRVLPS